MASDGHCYTYCPYEKHFWGWKCFYRNKNKQICGATVTEHNGFFTRNSLPHCHAGNIAWITRARFAIKVSR